MSSERHAGPTDGPAAEPDLAALTRSLDRHHALLPQPEPALTDALAALRRSADQAHLAVLGPEAVGKSTLVNQLVGTEVTPESPGLPGTVAPVYIRHADLSAPRYRVRHLGDRPEGTATEGTAPEDTASEDTLTEGLDGRGDFDRWMLQEHNRDNALGVLSGHVELSVPMLTGGLSLVDLPGLSGVSSAVAEQTERDLAGRAFSVVLVSMGRASLKTLLDTVRELVEGARPARVAAIVFNEVDPRLLTPERFPATLAMRRQSVTEILAPVDRDGRLGLLSAGLYCLNLLQPDGKHLADLRDRLTASVRTETRQAAADTSRYALPVLDAALDRRSRRVAAVLSGQVSRLEIERSADEALAGLWSRGALSSLVTTGRPGRGRGDELGAIEADRRDQDWKDVQSVYLEECARIARVLDDIDVPLRNELLITKDRAKEISTEVEEALAASRARIAGATSPGFRALAEALDAVAREREAFFDARIPTGLHRTAAQAGEDAEVEVGQYRYRSAGEMFADVTANRENGVTFQLFAALALPSFHYLGGGHLGHLRRGLKRVRGQASALLVGSDGAPAPSWLESRTALIDRVRTEMVQRISHLAGTAAERTELMLGALRRHQLRIGEARTDIAEWERRLRPLRKGAHGPASPR
ncbi:dynamin family protein [Streptomyces sp. NPDC059979]|uniref:dynamin family protein n=1 Tax=unclassified Streptomyces TaxID=2593676 RepID=UPI003664703B